MLVLELLQTLSQRLVVDAIALDALPHVRLDPLAHLRVTDSRVCARSALLSTNAFTSLRRGRGRSSE